MPFEQIKAKESFEQTKSGANNAAVNQPTEGVKDEQMTQWQSPAESNLITSPFGPRDMSNNKGGGSSYHKGIDMRAYEGVSIFAAADGKATVIGGDYNTVDVVHSEDLKTRYLHCSAIKVSSGQDVKKGDVIALAGGKGPQGANQYNAHLHFEVHQNGTKIDPEGFLIDKGISLSRKEGLAPRANSSDEATDNSGAGTKAEETTKPLSAQKESDAITWYTTKGFDAELIKRIQAVVGTEQTGTMDATSVQAVATWQKKQGYTGKNVDGKFGSGSAGKSGDKQLAADIDALFGKKASESSGSTTDSETTVIPDGKGINPKPGFDKQTNYPNSPYVETADYNAMKAAMGDTPYAQWDINDSRISSLYAAAKQKNKTKSTDSGNSTISSSGCGVTSLANLKGISPTEAAEVSMQNGCRVYNAGTSGTLYTKYNGSRVEKGSAQSALDSVANGQYLISSMAGCVWHKSANGGHFILVYGYDGSNVYVSDPASNANNRAVNVKSEFIKGFKYGYLF